MKQTSNPENLSAFMIFRGLSEEELRQALFALDAKEKIYHKGAVILHAGEVTERMGLVLQGSVTIENNDSWGNKTILGHAAAGEFFAETYASLPAEPLMVDVCANEKSRILFLRIAKIHKTPSANDGWAIKLTANLLRISMQKNLMLSTRSFHTSPKTIRERVLAYLNTVSLKNGASSFEIPYDRQQLADYLNLDRSALSKELGKMRRDGLIDFRKNRFTMRGHKI